MKKNRTIWLLLASAVMLLAVAGITYGWIVQNAALTTLMKILPPDTITIVPISATSGAEVVELDLDYRDGIDRKDENGTIHILRPICVRSTNPAHRLEIVHTTNLKDLSFAIYPATKVSSAQGFQLEELDRDKVPALHGEYKNQAADLLAKREVLENYQSTDDVADVHAYPLYWLAVQCYEETQGGMGQPVTSYTERVLDPETKTEKDFYCTYYYLEISWLEETKETDLFYIIAQNVAD